MSLLPTKNSKAVKIHLQEKRALLMDIGRIRVRASATSSHGCTSLRIPMSSSRRAALLIHSCNWSNGNMCLRRRSFASSQPKIAAARRWNKFGVRSYRMAASSWFTFHVIDAPSPCLTRSEFVMQIVPPPARIFSDRLSEQPPGGHRAGPVRERSCWQASSPR